MNKIHFFKHAMAAAIIAQVTPPVLAFESDTFELEEVIVTAQKRDERLTEVPISIASVSAENIEQTGIRQLKEVAEYVPNLSISSGTDFTSSVSIRGVGANSRNIGFDTRVGVYLDGVYLGQSPALNQELLDLERIEVLRGPQGTLFGKNTVAGAINLVSKKPGESLGGSVGIEYGNYNSRQVSASLNIPLTDNLYSKVAINKQLRDGLVENLATGNEINEQDGTSYRVQFRYAPGGSFEANLAFDGMETERLSYTGDAVTDTFGMAPAIEAPLDNEVSMNTDPYEERKIRGSALTLDWDLENDFAVKSISAYRDTDIFYINDTDYSAVDLISLAYGDSYKQFSQELQIISPDAGALKYVAGLYYYDQQGESLRQISPSPLAALLFGVDPNAPTNTDGTVDTRSYAAFLNGSYQLSERWKLGFGFRYSREDKDVDWAIDGSGSGAFGIATGSVNDDRSDSHFSPTANLNYAFSSEINGYVKYSSGYKSGGFNLDFITQDDLNVGIDFDKETVDSYELGLKGTLMERRVMFSLAAFQSNYSDYQVNQFVDLGDGGTSISIRNAAEVETQGLELEFTFRPSERWQLMAGVGLLEGEFAEYPGGGKGGADVSGNTLPGVSDYSLNLGAQYYHPVPALGAELLVRLDYSYRDDYYNTTDNEKSIQLRSGDSVQYGWVNDIDLLNGRLALQSTDGDWSAALWGRNLTDEDYLTRTSRDFLGTIRHFAGSPRTYGIELEYNF